MQHILKTLDEKRELARLGGGLKRIEAQHKKGQVNSTRTPRSFARPRFL